MRSKSGQRQAPNNYRGVGHTARMGNPFPAQMTGRKGFMLLREILRFVLTGRDYYGLYGSMFTIFGNEIRREQS